HQAATLATSDLSLRSKAMEEGLKIVEENFSYDRMPITIATEIHRAVKEITGNPDPYRGMKDEEIRISRELCPEISLGQDFRGLLQLSVLGNTMDFFRGFDTIRRDMRGPVRFARDDSARFEAKLEQATKVLYLADNAGEIFFDLPLVKGMEGFARVIYVVKGSPAGDDITLEDLKRAGMEGELERVISTGTATPGVVLSLASAEFKRELEAADLVLAKGMGYYEALSELPAEERVLFCLKAKCKPVADSLGVPLNSYVAMLW
ncbi:MAG: DUF89 domain-containing protein, partial [Dehalococcoidia bacterium]